MYELAVEENNQIVEKEILQNIKDLRILVKKNEIKCWKVKKGRFETVGPQGGSIRIKRKNNIQIERYSRQRIRHRFYITWIDDCNYELTLKKSKIKSLINHTEIKLGDAVAVYLKSGKSRNNSNQVKILMESE